MINTGVVTPQVLHQAPRPETTSVRPAATTSTTPWRCIAKTLRRASGVTSCDRLGTPGEQRHQAGPIYLAPDNHRHNPDERVRSSQSRASVSRVGTARGRTDHPVRRHRPLRWRPDCRAAAAWTPWTTSRPSSRTPPAPSVIMAIRPRHCSNPRPSICDRRQERSYFQDRSVLLPGPIGALARRQGSGGSYRAVPARVHGLDGRCPPGR